MRETKWAEFRQIDTDEKLRRSRREPSFVHWTCLLKMAGIASAIRRSIQLNYKRKALESSMKGFYIRASFNWAMRVAFWAVSLFCFRCGKDYFLNISKNPLLSIFGFYLLIENWMGTAF